MIKVVVNACAGGFSLSHEGTLLFAKRKGLEIVSYYSNKNPTNLQDKYVKNPDNDKPMSDSIFNKLVYCAIPKYIDSPEFVDEIFISTYIYKPDSYNYYNFDLEKYNNFRSDQELIATVEALGDLASGLSAELKIVEIPDDVDWYLDVSDSGYESIHEKHRIWRAD